jgi:hypothetical protein
MLFWFIIGIVAAHLYFWWLYGKYLHGLAEHGLQQSIIKNHPFWHTIFLGFGYLQNQWGLRYDDAIGAATVNHLIPGGALMYSPIYETTLRNHLVVLFRQDPDFFIETIFAKIGVIFGYFLRWANVGIIAACLRPQSLVLTGAFGVALAWSALPGLLTMPVPCYLLGFSTFAALWGLVSVGNLLSGPSPKSLNRVHYFLIGACLLAIALSALPALLSIARYAYRLTPYAQERLL